MNLNDLLVNEPDVGYFNKISRNPNDDILEWLLQIDEGLTLKVLIVITTRVRGSNSNVLGLNKNEFVISKRETAKFGLKKNQGGKVYRCIQNLIEKKIIEKTDRKTDRRSAVIYRYISNTFIDTDLQNSPQNRPAVDHQQTRTEKDRKIDNNKYVELENLKLQYEKFFKGKTFKITKTKATKLKERLKVYSFDELVTALENASLSWHGKVWKNFSVDWLLKNDDNVDKLLNVTIDEQDQKPQSKRKTIQELEEITGAKAINLLPEHEGTYREMLNIIAANLNVPDVQWQRSIKPQIEARYSQLKSKGVKITWNKKLR